MDVRLTVVIISQYIQHTNIKSLHCTPETNIPQLYLNFYGKFCIYVFFFNHNKKNSFQIRELKSRNPLRDGNLDQKAWAT